MSYMLTINGESCKIISEDILFWAFERSDGTKWITSKYTSGTRNIEIIISNTIIQSQTKIDNNG
jgi:hypothetical protein